MFGTVHSPCVSSSESERMSYETIIKSLGSGFWGCFALHAHFSMAQNPAPDILLTLLKSRYRSYMKLMEQTSKHCSTHGIAASLPDLSSSLNLKPGDGFGDTSAAFARLLELHKTVACILRSTADNALSAPMRAHCTRLLDEVQRWCYEEARMANATMRLTSTAWIYNLPVNLSDADEVADSASSSLSHQVQRAFANSESL